MRVKSPVLLVEGGVCTDPIIVVPLLPLAEGRGK